MLGSSLCPDHVGSESKIRLSGDRKALEKVASCELGLPKSASSHFSINCSLRSAPRDCEKEPLAVKLGEPIAFPMDPRSETDEA
mmetsp:Transcript_14428/g.29515  ORF Transcript_14428/g.29515 Transcript_14428/m.29515 type:complete len:84 (+) Transcript_14428:476-727(+)